MKRRGRKYEQELPVGPQLARVTEQVDRSEGEPVARELLRLQEGGGNEAVATMLARRVTKTVDKDNPEEKPETDKPATATIVFSNGIGVIPLLAFTRGDGEWKVNVPSSDQDAVLYRASVSGERIDKVVISRPGFELTLNDVYISSASASGHDERVISLSLNYGSEEWGKKEPRGKPD